MEVRAYAQRLLSGPSLDDKLFTPTELTDAAPQWRGTVPDRPGRTASLRWADEAGEASPTDVPDDPRARGRLLHAFANHELLAIELMALALLRFDDAPAAFRRGLVQTIAEEQRHLSLYLDRMQALGVSFGDAPLSGFFWRAMAPLESPAAFVAHMSLTFEQANLDFATHYAGAFARMGDDATAAVLQTVLDDEIGHVALGLRWFDRWRSDAKGLFEAHAEALVPPLQIVRAKAMTFCDAPRKRAGLPADYVERLRTAGGSRGRPATLWWFNGAAEQEAERGMSFTPNRGTAQTLRDLQSVPLLLAAPSDVVLVERPPDAGFLGTLAEAGVPLPRFEVADLHRTPWPAPASVGPIGSTQPWGISPRSDAFAATARERAMESSPRWSSEIRALYDKRTTVELAADFVASDAEPSWIPARLGPRIAASWFDVLERHREFAEAGYATLVKPCFGASGRGHRRLRDGDREDDRRAVDALLRRGPVLVEPWFDVVAQLSIRLRIEPERGVVLGVGRGISDARGQFEAAVLGPFDVGLSGEVRRWLRGDGRDPNRISRMANAVTEVVTARAGRANYVGPAGVDALLVRCRDGLRLRPIVDFNPRLTMGHVAAALESRVSRRARGVWAMTSLATARDLGFDGLPSWARSTEAVQCELQGGRRRITNGVLHTTDPAHCAAVVTSLSVAATVDAALSALRVRRPPAPQSHRSPRTHDP